MVTLSLLRYSSSKTIKKDYSNEILYYKKNVILQGSRIGAQAVKFVDVISFHYERELTFKNSQVSETFPKNNF